MNHFDTKTISALSRKGVQILGPVAVPAFEGDVYYTGTAYQLNSNGQLIMRTHSQVVIMAKSSWTPDYNPMNDGWNN